MVEEEKLKTSEEKAKKKVEKKGNRMTIELLPNQQMSNLQSLQKKNEY